MDTPRTGRRPKDAATKQGRNVSVRFTDDQRARVEAYCARRHVKVASWAHAALLTIVDSEATP